MGVSLLGFSTGISGFGNIFAKEISPSLKVSNVAKTKAA